MKARLKLIAVWIITERYLSILSQGLNKPLATSTQSQLCCFHVLILSHFTSRLVDLPQQDLIKLCRPSLQILFGEKRKMQFHRGMVHFFSFFIYYLRHGRNKTYRESQIEQNSQAMYTWPYFLNYLPSAAPLKEAESVLDVPSHDSCKAILQVWFSQLFFNALLVCPLISPLVWVCLSTHKKYNLTWANFVRTSNDIFSKAKFVDKGWLWIYSSWNVYVVCPRLGWLYASASLWRQEENPTCVLF